MSMGNSAFRETVVISYKSAVICIFLSVIFDTIEVVSLKAKGCTNPLILSYFTGTKINLASYYFFNLHW